MGRKNGRIVKWFFFVIVEREREKKEFDKESFLSFFKKIDKWNYTVHIMFHLQLNYYYYYNFYC